MSELTDFIRTLSEEDTKTLSQKALKVCEEVGELAKVVLPFDNASGTIHRFVDRNNILEEIADVYLTDISIAYSLGFTDDEIEEAILTKAKKWARLQRSESKVDDKIPFEIHITIESWDNERFIRICKALGVKPIVLNLQAGSKSIEDVMTSSVHFGNNRSAYDEMKRISKGMQTAGYKVVREKIETVPWHPAAPTEENSVMPKDCYFETHIGVTVRDDEEKERLGKLAKSLSVHMSKNAFKNNPNGSFTQMLTYRNYTGSMETFESEASIIYNIIELNGFEVEKQIIEFSIYDTKISHDSKWLEG